MLVQIRPDWFRLVQTQSCGIALRRNRNKFQAFVTMWPSSQADCTDCTAVFYEHGWFDLLGLVCTSLYFSRLKATCFNWTPSKPSKPSSNPALGLVDIALGPNNSQGSTGYSLDGRIPRIHVRKPSGLWRCTLTAVDSATQIHVHDAFNAAKSGYIWILLQIRKGV